jgi:hypothetical protein
MLHKDTPLEDRHPTHAWEYADAAARTAATGFVSGDVGKLALQLNDYSLWMLTATTPTWQAFGASGVDGAAGVGQLFTCGFPVNSSGAYLCTLTYNETTRTVTITPTAATFKVWAANVEYTKTGAQSIVHAATQGGHFIYYDETGTLVTNTSPWDLLKHAPVCYVHWDATNSRGIPFEERHHAGRDVWWHRNQHFAEGTKATSGFGISGYTLSDGSADSMVTWAMATGRVEDEDIRVDTQVLADNGPYTILERSGAAGDWRISRTSTLPFTYTGNALQYNQNTGATWQRTNVTEDYFVNMWVFGLSALPTTDMTPSPTATQQIVIVPGQAIFSSQGAAEAESVSSLAWGTVPFQEMVPLYRITMRYNASAPSAYTNTARCAIYSVTRIIGTSVTVTQAGSAQHGSLSGLLNDDHTQYAKSSGAGRADFNFNTPSDGQVAKYDNATGKWINGAATSAPPQITGTASGSITAGKPCVVKSDGTIAQAAVSASSNTTKVTFGSLWYVHAMAANADGSKIVVAYSDGGTSYYGRVVVGTVSGGVITFGTPVTFVSEDVSGRQLGVSFDTVAGNWVVAWGGATQNKAVAVSVSGTVPTVGTPIVLGSSHSSVGCDVVYDSFSAKHVALYLNSADSMPTAVPITLATMTLTAGTALALHTVAGVSNGAVDIHSMNDGRAVAAWVETSTGKTKACVVRVNSTGMLLDAGPVATIVNHNSNVAYHPNLITVTPKGVIASVRSNSTDSSKLWISLAQVNGNVIQAGQSALMLNNAIAYPAVASVGEQIYCWYRDDGNSYYVTQKSGHVVDGAYINDDTRVAISLNHNHERVCIAGSLIAVGIYDGANGVVTLVTPLGPNATTENFVGLANASVTDGQTVTVDSIGGTNSSQSGLTTGRKYYIDPCSVSALATSGSILVGTALSATKIHVKG